MTLDRIEVDWQTGDRYVFARNHRGELYGIRVPRDDFLRAVAAMVGTADTWELRRAQEIALAEHRRLFAGGQRQPMTDLRAAL